MNKALTVLLTVFFVILSLLTPIFFYLGVGCFLFELTLLSLLFVSLPYWLSFALSIHLNKHSKRWQLIEIMDAIRLWVAVAFIAASILLSLTGFVFPTIILVVLFLAGISLLPQLSHKIKEHSFPFKKPWIITTCCMVTFVVAMGIFLFLIEQGYIAFSPYPAADTQEWLLK
ncbi:MAG: hypothetical protein IJC19_07630 [Clostridia bacterium]|nr:hypothetical protein [Clostridia bacterium]